VRAKGDILLVSCYEPGHQPQSVATAVASLRAAGFDPACLDLAVEEIGPPDAPFAPFARARLVVIAAQMHTALAIGLRVAARARRENPAARLVFFGLYAVLNRELLGGRADAVLGPDAEEALSAIASALDRGAPIPAGLASPAPPGRRPSPQPARDALPPLRSYARLAIAGEERVAGHVEGTRGCKHLCRHCPIPPVYGGRFFAVPREIVLEDARRQIAAGARHIDFGDPDFLNGPQHGLRLARALHAAHPEVTFSFTAKIEHIVRHRALLPELAACRAVFVVSAVESLSDRVLDALAKGHRAADVREALAIVRGAGLSLRPTFVPFTPWATLHDYLDLCRFIRAERLEEEVDPVQLSIRLLVPPGSLLLAEPALAAALGPLDEGALTHRWQHDDPRMDRLEADVAALVEEAAQAGAPATATFARIHALAAAAAGVTVEAAPPVKLRRGPPPPRLTEAWFCCAQPTRRQLDAF
jgi:radical SAM superfamily enzyme YgiQ (UPF0313 family)